VLGGRLDNADPDAGRGGSWPEEEEAETAAAGGVDDATTEDGDGDEDVDGKSDATGPPWAWAAARRAFIELIGSEGSKAEAGIPAACAAASSCAAEDAAAEEAEDGLERPTVPLLGGRPAGERLWWVLRSVPAGTPLSANRCNWCVGLDGGRFVLLAVAAIWLSRWRSSYLASLW